MAAEIRRGGVGVEAERYRRGGDVPPPAEGFHSRLSDLLNREGVRFIPLIDATMTGRDGEAPQQRPFVAVARDHVQVAYEASDGAPLLTDGSAGIRARRANSPPFRTSTSAQTSPSRNGSSGCASSTIQASCSSSPSSWPADQPA